MSFLKTNNFKSYSDEELMKLVCKQNNKAFEELYKRYNNKLQFFFFRILNKDKEKAKDFTHDLFIKLIEKRTLFNNSHIFSTWVYTIALNMFKNELRKEKTVNKYNEQLLPDEYISNNKNLLDDIDLPYYKKKLDIALEELEESKRIVFILRYQEELSVKEIAEILECPEGTVKSRIFYAIEALAKKLTTFKHTMIYEHTKQ
ncbi:MAG: RNA polymerase sigma factor [Bacteroidia bacterium]|nr:RNA polymerase sigma factor [Bacteroidia bacterium]